MGGGSRRGANPDFTLHESDIVAVTETIIIDRIETGRPHCFGGVQFFDDALGATPAVPSAGTVQLSVSTVNSGNGGTVFEPFTQDLIDLAQPDTACTRSWAANTTHVKAIPTGIVGASFYKLIVTCNTN